MNAHVGLDLRCPVCQRPQRDLGVRSGDAWVRCWHQRCKAVAWVCVVPAAQPTALDVAAAVGERLAASLLASFQPAPLIAIHVPATEVHRVRSATRSALIATLTTLLGTAPLTPMKRAA